MAGGALGGRYGVVNGLTGIRNWQLNDDGTLAVFANSATAAGQGRLPGITAWTGGYSNHGALPPVLPGVLFGFQGFTAPDNGILGGVGYKYSGNAMVDSVSINWDWQGGNVIENQTSFQGALSLAYVPGAYPYADVGVSNPEPSTGTRIDYSVDGTTWTTLNNLTQASLQITNGVQPVVNSSTAGGTDRKAGLTDWSANISIQDTLLGSGLVKSSAYQFRFYTDATHFWLLKWCRVKGFTGLQVDPQSGAIIGYTAALEMCGVLNGVLGSLIAPAAGSSYWGA